jgi:hypothetical protein
VNTIEHKGGTALGNPSPQPQPESSRQYERLLKGKTTSAKYVKTLKAEARSRVQAQSAGRRRATGA